MRETLGAVALTSFLDLISCGLGAALLLFLIGATATPVTRPESPNQAVVIVARGLDGPRGEIGLEWRPAGDERWRRTVEGQARALPLPSDPESGAAALLILRPTGSARLEVRPYLRSFLGPDGGGEGCRVSIQAHGQGVSVQNPGQPPVAMPWPNAAGQVLQVRVDRDADGPRPAG